MACLPITDSASLSQTYYSGGGGGGGSNTPNPSFSTVTLATGSGGTSFNTSNGVINFTSQMALNGTDDGRGAIFYSPANGEFGMLLLNPAGNGDVTLSVDGTYGYVKTAPGVPLNVASQDLVVSSINGATPGSGGFFSTLSVPLPTQTSTVIFEVTPGTWSYNGLAVFAGNTEPLNGFVNAINQVGVANYGSLFANSNSQPAAGIVPVEMTLNFGDSGLSTIKLICANNSASLAGTWQGGVFKLF